MLTPRQSQYLQSLTETSPAFALFQERFDLVPTESKEFKRNQAIAGRVEELISQIALAPKRPRKITYPRKPWDEPDLSMYGPGECPF